jgi:predicted Zn-dependent protease
MPTMYPSSTDVDNSYGTRRSPIGPKLLMALVVAGFSLFSYFSHTEMNPITNEKQHLTLTSDEEIALGVQAAPEMEQEYGGESTNQADQQLVDRIGERIVAQSAAHKTPYKFDFHVLADQNTVNAFALPGGQVFITSALLHRLKTEGQIAGVVGHEIGHVVARHSAAQLAKKQLTQGLTGAAAIAMYDPDNPSSRNSAAVAAMIGSLVGMKFGRADETEADRLGVRFISESGYDPRAMIGVMEILKNASKTRTPEFFSTHPNPENRIQVIEQSIAERYPNGVPGGLEQ